MASDPEPIIGPPEGPSSTSSSSSSSGGDSSMTASKCCGRTASLMYDSDQEAPSGNDHLDWRLDADDSLSDWTIEIRSRPRHDAAMTSHDSDSSSSTSSADVPEPQISTYRVHKCVLAVGPKRSEYFFRLFHNKGAFAESASETSRIELENVAAEAFPVLLDYAYSSANRLDIRTQNATPLHYLGQYFEIRQLRWEAKAFWREDLSMENCHIYYEHAMLLRDEKILECIAKQCSASINSLTVNMPIFKASVQLSDAELWTRILQEDIGKNSKHKSQLIAAFFVAQLEKDKDGDASASLDAEAFSELTKETFLPRIDRMAAKPLLMIESTLLKKTQHENCLTSLQNRCIQSMASSWSRVEVGSDQDMDFLVSQSPVVLANLFAACLTKSKKDYESAMLELDTLLGDLHRASQELLHSKREWSASQRALNEIKYTQERTSRLLQQLQHHQQQQEGQPHKAAWVANVQDPGRDDVRVLYEVSNGQRIE